jgi:hypothetical protein
LGAEPWMAPMTPRKGTARAMSLGVLGEWTLGAADIFSLLGG